MYVSIFFQISPTDFLEAAPLDDNNHHFAIRIVSYSAGYETFVILKTVTIDELTLLASILRGKLMPSIRNTLDIKRLFYDY